MVSKELAVLGRSENAATKAGTMAWEQPQLPRSRSVARFDPKNEIFTERRGKATSRAARHYAIAGFF